MISRSSLFRTVLGVGLPLLASPRPVAAALAGTSGPGSFDRAEFERRLSMPYKHRQVFAASHLDGGVVLHYIENSLRAYADLDGFGEGPATLHVAAVLYGSSIATMLSDAAWAQFSLGAFFNRLHENVRADAMQSPYVEVARRLRTAGVSFFVCRNALHAIATTLASAPEGDGLADTEIYATLAHSVIADALIVPAGVAALNALQEARFTLVQATSGAG